MKIKDVRPRILPSVRSTFAERFHIKMMKSYIILQFRENGSVAHSVKMMKIYSTVLFYWHSTHCCRKKAQFSLFKIFPCEICSNFFNKNVDFLTKKWCVAVIMLDYRYTDLSQKKYAFRCLEIQKLLC